MSITQGHRHSHIATLLYSHSQIMEAAYLPINSRMGRESAVYIYNFILFHHYEELIYVIYREINGNGAV